MAEASSVTISVLALCMSAVTAWLTLFRRGTVKMTQPTVIFFGPDNPRSQDEPPLPKVFLRTLLFATEAVKKPSRKLIDRKTEQGKLGA